MEHFKCLLGKAQWTNFNAANSLKIFISFSVSSFEARQSAKATSDSDSRVRQEIEAKKTATGYSTKRGSHIVIKKKWLCDRIRKEPNKMLHIYICLHIDTTHPGDGAWVQQWGQPQKPCHLRQGLPASLCLLQYIHERMHKPYTKSWLRSTSALNESRIRARPPASSQHELNAPISSALVPSTPPSSPSSARTIVYQMCVKYVDLMLRHVLVSILP